MCTITKKYRGKTFTGYKYAIKKEGKYYSWWTGVEYKEGRVQATKVTTRGCVNSVVAGNATVAYCPEMKGKTGAFKNKKTAIREGFHKNQTSVIIKITLSGELFNGYSDIFKQTPIVLGTHIDKIEEI